MGGGSARTFGKGFFFLQHLGLFASLKLDTDSKLSSEDEEAHGADDSFTCLFPSHHLPSPGKATAPCRAEVQ